MPHTDDRSMTLISIMNHSRGTGLLMLSQPAGALRPSAASATAVSTAKPREGDQTDMPALLTGNLFTTYYLRPRFLQKPLKLLP